jgi:hypothetical protein
MNQHGAFMSMLYTGSGRTINGRRVNIPLVSTVIGNRNDKCFCGSGLKFKKCCIDKIDQPYKLKAKSL